jgi:single-stranded DNA-binding protein
MDSPGTLHRDPVTRTSKTGKSFVTALLRSESQGETLWASIVDEAAQAELMRLKAGEALTIQGALRVETYEKDAETKLSLSVVADHVLALRQPTRIHGVVERA